MLGKLLRRFGDNVSPALQCPGRATDAKQLVLIMDDLDVRMPKPIIHTIAIAPPPFLLFALDERPDEVTDHKALLAAIAGHVLARGGLTGTYER